MAFFARFICALLLFTFSLVIPSPASADWGTDITPPTSTITVTCGTPPSPSSITSGGSYTCNATSATVQFSCSDAQTGCKQTTYNFGVTNPAAGTATPANSPYPNTYPSPGFLLPNSTTAYSITIRSEDNQGNLETQISFTLRVISSCTASSYLRCGPTRADGVRAGYCGSGGPISGLNNANRWPNSCIPPCASTWSYYAAGNGDCTNSNYGFCYMCEICTPGAPRNVCEAAACTVGQEKTNL